MGYRHFLVREVWVGSGRDWHPVADRVATDDEPTGVDSRSANGSLQHLGIFDSIAFTHILANFGILQLWRTFDGIFQVHLHAVGQAFGDGLAEIVRYIQRKALHTGNILDGILRRHRGIGDDMRAILWPVFLHYPLQHLATAVVVEVGVYIRKVHTVWIEETFE